MIDYYKENNEPHKEKIKKKKKDYKNNNKKKRKIDKKNISINKVKELDFILSEQEKVNKINFNKLSK